jgi:hypoxanthine phosphoribosyltransferase
MMEALRFHRRAAAQVATAPAAPAAARTAPMLRRRHRAAAAASPPTLAPSMQRRRRQLTTAAAASAAPGSQPTPGTTAATSSTSDSGSDSDADATAAATAAAHPLPPEVKAVLFTQEQIARAVERMGREISRDFSGDDSELVVCGVLTGAFIFTADLARAIAPTRGLRVDFLRASSYGANAESSGNVRVSGMGGDRDEARWRDKRVVLVEDIIDSGHTLRRLADELARLGAREVRVAALLDKRGRRKAEFRSMKPDYVGFEDCPDEFVVGYGLDYNEMFRTLPYIAALKEEVYTPAASMDEEAGGGGPMARSASASP